MHRTPPLLLAAAVVLLALAAFAQDAPAPAPAAAPVAEPPLLLEVEVAGNKTAVHLNEPFTVNVAGRPVRMTVTAKPYRVFDRHGVTFHYPRQHAWEYDNSEPGVEIYSLDGQSNVIMLMRYEKEFAADDLREQMAGAMAAQYGLENTKKSPTTLALAGQQRNGTRLDVTLAGERLRQDIYALETRDSAVILVIQDSLSGDKATAETEGVIQMLQDTLKLVP